MIHEEAKSIQAKLWGRACLRVTSPPVAHYHGALIQSHAFLGERGELTHLLVTV